MKAMKKGMATGNSAAAYGVKLSRAEVIPVYPITPQTTLMEKIVEMISARELEAEFVPVESEHSAMAVAIAAEATGVRCFTASSAQGIVYMQEMLFVASGMRLPIVMCMVNRSLGAPNSILADLQDSLQARDASWIQIYAESPQEIVDTVIQAYKIAEDPRVLLPVAVCYEGFIISHCMETVTFPEQEEVDSFLPEYRPEHAILDPENPIHFQTILTDDAYYMEYRYQQQVAMENTKQVIEEVDRAYGERFGRRYGGLLESQWMEGAEVVVLTLGAVSSTARLVAREMRGEWYPIGFIKLRAFRPFPKEALQSLLGGVKAVVVIERDASIGSGGIVYAELTSALYQLEHRPIVLNYIAGLGGREVGFEALKALMERTFDEIEQSIVADPIRWLDVRGVS